MQIGPARFNAGRKVLLRHQVSVGLALECGLAAERQRVDYVPPRSNRLEDSPKGLSRTVSKRASQTTLELPWVLADNKDVSGGTFGGDAALSCGGERVELAACAGAGAFCGLDSLNDWESLAGEQGEHWNLRRFEWRVEIRYC
jgi:hypothetical protein